VKLEGSHTFPVARERLWEALLDPTLLVRVLPGCEPLEPAGENRWRAAMTLQVGPVKGRFQGTLELSELDPPRGYRMKIDGTGTAGFLRGEGRITLVEAQAATALGYEVDAQVGGRIAAVGQRLVESSARALARQGLEGLERELAGRIAQPAAAAAAAAAGAPATQAGPTPAPAGPSQTAFAARFALGLWRELPASWRWGALALAAGLLALLALWWLAD
jgi:carbon monoxide dehydrogenase subunit G